MKQIKLHQTFIPAFILALAPLHARAAGATLTSILDAFSRSIAAFVPVGVGLALFVFMWGLVRSMYATKGSAEIATARKHMVWGLIGLTIVVSVWGFVKILQDVTGVDPSKTDCTSPTMQIGSQVGTKSCFD